MTTMPPNATITKKPPTGPEYLAGELRALYGLAFQPLSWTDCSDHAFLDATLIERSIALLAPELTGELLDVGCDQQPYADYFKHVTRKRACDFSS